MTNKKNNTNIKNAIVDIAKSLENVFKKYSKNTREKAWKKITSKDGEKEINKILIDPNRPINTFQKLATQKDENAISKGKIKFHEWLELRENSKVPKKYLAGLKNKGKYGSKEAMKREIEQFKGKDEYKLNWDADYKDGKRIKTKKSKATKAFEKRFGKQKEK
jgi:hypothetical protein